MPSMRCPGKKAHACDQCAGTKKACDSGWPCSSCVLKRRSCTYERLPLRDENSPCFLDLAIDVMGSAEGTSLEPGDYFTTLEFSEWTSTNPQALGQIGSPNTLANWEMTPHFNAESHLSLAVPPRECLRFLLNVVKDDGLNSVFNFDRLWRYRESQRHHGCARGDALTEYSQSTVDNSLLPTNVTKYLHLNQTSNDLSYTHMAQWLADPLFSQSKGIWELLRAARSRNSRSASGQLSAEDGRLLEFFGPAKLRIFLDLFWAGWFPHCPIIHKPTFDASKTPCALVASMAMIGACMSLGEDRAQAQKLLDTLEAVVFENALFQDELEEDESDEQLLQILQAGHFVCVLQNWEGNDKGKKRIRQQRFTSLVAVSPSSFINLVVCATEQAFQAARLIGLSRARHPWEKYLAYPGSFNWQEFCTTESIIR